MKSNPESQAWDGDSNSSDEEVFGGEGIVMGRGPQYEAIYRAGYVLRGEVGEGRRSSCSMSGIGGEGQKERGGKLVPNLEGLKEGCRLETLVRP